MSAGKSDAEMATNAHFVAVMFVAARMAVQVGRGVCCGKRHSNGAAALAMLSLWPTFQSVSRHAHTLWKWLPNGGILCNACAFIDAENR